MTHRGAGAAGVDFDRMFAESDDPWGFRARWYEHRKRALMLASLPRRRYRTGFEPGCANGETTVALADRCDTLLAVDGCARAVELARRRLHARAGVRVEQMWVPAQWPASVFDLIVVSELAYYLTASGCAQLADAAIGALAPGGHLVCCHWRPPIAGCALDGDAVHAIFEGRVPLPGVATYRDADFCLAVWSADATSVAAREGLR